MTRVGIVEDHPLFGDALRRVLTDSGFEVVFHVASVAAGADALRLHSPDVVLLDLSLPDGDGLELPRRFGAEFIARPVWIVLSSFDDVRRANAARAAGCRGFLSKTQHVEHIVAAIRETLSGEEVIEPRAKQLVGEVRGPTERELACLALVAEGFTNRDIAQALGVSAETVKTLLSNVRDKLGAADRAQAVALAYERGLLGEV